MAVCILWCSFVITCHSQPLDNIQVMVIVWRFREYYQNSELHCAGLFDNVHIQQHTYMNSSYKFNRLGLSRWDPYAVRRGCYLELSYCTTVEWFWWIQAWSRRPTDFLQCFGTVGLVTWPVRIVSEMTYNRPMPQHYYYCVSTWSSWLRPPDVMPLPS